MKEAVIVSTARTGLGKSFRGAFNDTEAPVLGGHVIRAAVAKSGIDPADVDDVVMGAVAQQGTQAYNIARLELVPRRRRAGNVGLARCRSIAPAAPA